MTQEKKSASPDQMIAFQGEYGAYSDLACRQARPDLTTLPCRTFDDAFAAVREGKAKLAMIPIENSVAGRVADIHHLLPDSGLHIIGEHYQRINHHLLALPGTKLEDVTEVYSHVHALNQCRDFLREHGIKPVVAVDTAGSAKDIAVSGDQTKAVIASALAGEIYGLESLAADIEDAEHNTTRFVVMAQEAVVPPVSDEMSVTSFVFRVRNVPAALFKALGGFATNGINITKLESYIVDGTFIAAQFYADCEGHPDNQNLRLALEELEFFTQSVKILGVYPPHPYRLQQKLPAE
jgi:prephenate dehydratase